MYVPYDPGQARSHGPLLHVTDMRMFLESTDGRVRFPKKYSGLCPEADYELLRLLSTKRSPTMPGATRIPPWLSQRRYGEAPPPRRFVSMGHNAQEGEPPT
eukprot:7774507-Pyramimonas_sp.AAC.1